MICPICKSTQLVIQNNNYYCPTDKVYIGPNTPEFTAKLTREQTIADTLKQEGIIAPRPTDSYDYANPLIRVLAFYSDMAMILGIFTILFLLIFGIPAIFTNIFLDNDILRHISAFVMLLFYFFFIPIGFIGYFIWSWSMRDGQTLGAKLLGIKLVRETEIDLDIGTAFIRWLVMIFISTLFFYLGDLWALWDSKSQTWQDKAVGTIVVKSGRPPHILIAILLVSLCILNAVFLKSIPVWLQQISQHNLSSESTTTTNSSSYPVIKLTPQPSIFNGVDYPGNPQASASAIINYNGQAMSFSYPATWSLHDYAGSGNATGEVSYLRFNIPATYLTILSAEPTIEVIKQSFPFKPGSSPDIDLVVTTSLKEAGGNIAYKAVSSVVTNDGRYIYLYTSAGVSTDYTFTLEATTVKGKNSQLEQALDQIVKSIKFKPI